MATIPPGDVVPFASLAARPHLFDAASDRRI